jgi:hypothetical protein
MSSDERIDIVTARVRWLDRYRRVLAIIAAAIVAPMAFARFAAALGADWPAIHGVALSVVVGLVAWLSVEVALAWVTAVWETEGACLMRAKRMPPRAILLPRKRKRPGARVSPGRFVVE